MIFSEAIHIILKHEGGYVNHSADPGGETKYGITKRSYPGLDIKNLTKDQAIEIYRRDFWDKSKIMEYPYNIRLQVFDMAVNMGLTNAIKVVQRAINIYGYHLNVDGIAGPKTFEALDRIAPVKDDFPHMITIERMAYYANLVISRPKLSVFLKGWNIRAKDVLLESLK